MIRINRINNHEKTIKFNSNLGRFKLYFVDQTIKITNNNLKISIQKNRIFFNDSLNVLSLLFEKNIISFFLKKGKLLFSVNTNSNKKNIINLYNKLVKIKIKGILQGFKLNLFLKGIGFKSLVEKDNLILKLGFSHNLLIIIPSNIKIINQLNNIIFISRDYMFLSQFVSFIKNLKNPESYKGKGLILKNEKIIIKEGKKSKK